MKHNEAIQSKLFTLDSLLQAVSVWRTKDLPTGQAGKKIVFTNGCFDLLHLGHIDYLAKAADLGNILIVGLNTDNSVRTLKGKDRPINDGHSRATLLAALSFVDAVILFDEETPYNLIKSIEPDILVKGSDYKIEEIAGHEIVQAKGGKVITIDLLSGYSTTLIEDKILKTKL